MFTNLLPKLLAAAVALAAIPTPATAPRWPDEGMWPFDGLPRQLLKERYGFEPTAAWLDHVRLGSVRFDTGGSGSFVSADGLVMTNHHVALTTLQKVSTPEKDWVADGFSARLYGSEVPGTDLTLRQLIEIRDVTAAAKAAESKGKTGEERGNLLRDALTAICAEITDKAKHIIADPVRLYDGAEFRIYVYHVYDDVRVVFAPEKQVAFFGGDYDNFTYPRYDLDCAFFRVYEDGAPVDSSKWYFPWNGKGAADGELVFVSGHPGGTERLLTYDEMVFHRDYRVPDVVRQLRMLCERTKAQMDASPQQAFALRDQYFGFANSLKAYEGHLAGLLDAGMMAKMKARDEELIAKSGRPEVAAAFATIAKGYSEYAVVVERTSKLLQASEGAEMEAARSERLEARAHLDREVVPPAKAAINRARFEVYGKSMYPDATFTLRLAFGTVKGYEAGTTQVPYKTTLYGLFGRSADFDNAPPFDLPKRWFDAKDKLDLATPINFVCTADIIGGNSGSQVLDRDARVVGLVFDGNIESLPGNYWFDERVNRCVSVHTAAILEAIEKVYGEAELAGELRGKKAKAAAGVK